MDDSDDGVPPNLICPGASLEGADLTEHNLRWSNLSETRLVEANLSGLNLAETDLSKADLQRANLSGAIIGKLSKAYLHEADLSGAYMENADLSDVKSLRRADLSGARLQGSNLSGRDLLDTDLSGADLREADLSEADLRESDMSRADLRGTNLTGANLLEANLSAVVLSRETVIDGIGAESERISTASFVSSAPGTPQRWDTVARVYHDLKNAYSENGLIGKARKYRVRERTARRKEAFAEKKLKGYSAWLGSLLSRIITGYGVQLRWVGGIAISIYCMSVAIYWYIGMNIGESLYYSLITFVTAPPSPPSGGIIGVTTAMVETFAGTLLIILLGYVLGSREQV